MTVSKQVIRSALATALLSLGLGALAQPMGGMGPGRGPGDGPPGRGAQRPERTLDDLLPPDPWRLWFQRVTLEQAALTARPDQVVAVQAFVQALDTVQRLSGQRLQQMTRPPAPPPSLGLDLGRELQAQAGDAQAWALALQQLQQRWQAARERLDGGQRARLEGAWLAAFSPQPLNRDRSAPARD